MKLYRESMKTTDLADFELEDYYEEYATKLFQNGPVEPTLILADICRKGRGRPFRIKAKVGDDYSLDVEAHLKKFKVHRAIFAATIPGKGNIFYTINDPEDLREIIDMYFKSKWADQY